MPSKAAPRNRQSPFITSRDLRRLHSTPYDIRIKMKGQTGDFCNGRIENIEFRRIRGKDGMAMDVVQSIGVTMYDKNGSHYHMFSYDEWDENVQATWRRY